MTQLLLSVALMSTEWIILALLLLSVWSIAIIVERIVVLRWRAGDLRKVEGSFREAMRKGRAAEAIELLRKTDTSSARVVLRVSEMTKTDATPFDEALAIALSEEKIDLERRVAILGTLGSNAPYVGLLGTVLGIIHAFHNLSQHVQGGPTVILKGISEALVATALGLLIAIPAVAAYNFFVRSIRKILVKAENAARGLVPVLAK